MNRVQERTKKLVKLLHEAEKLIKAEQVAADALGIIGTYYQQDQLKNLTEVASIRTMAAMQLEDGLYQAKSRLETFQLALHAVHQAEQEHEQVIPRCSLRNCLILFFQAIVSHLKNADPGRVVSSRGRYHQNLLEALVAGAHLQSFQYDFKSAVTAYFKVR